VTVIGNGSVQVAFALTQQPAQLELRGAPAGVEVQAGTTLLGRTLGSGTFIATVPPGTQTLRVTRGSDSREIVQVFEPGRTVTWEWTSVAPGVKTSVAAPRVDPAEQEWEAVRGATDPAALRAYIGRYPHGAHAPEAQSLLDRLVWQQTGQNDAAALQSYLQQFPNGAHVPDARSRLDELAWNAVDKTDLSRLRSFVQQNPGSLHQKDAQALIDKLEKQLEAERLAAERARQSEQQQVQAKAPAIAPPVQAAGSPVAATLKVNPKDGLKYVLIRPGKFTMGCSKGDTECGRNERPAHEVTIAKEFWLGQTPVTQAAYQRVTGSNPSRSKGDNLPVENVNWKEARNYCKAIGGRLPTEAEWEYAARADSTSARYGSLDDIAWYQNNSGGRAHEVGRKQPNAFGLYDMLGNVWQWTEDWYGDKYYQLGESRDPVGPPAGTKRTLRGGSWGNAPEDVRASDRFWLEPRDSSDVTGVRCVGK
jgi:formylglycine-generating enzyme required for sulfatase activity